MKKFKKQIIGLIILCLLLVIFLPTSSLLAGKTITEKMKEGLGGLALPSTPAGGPEVVIGKLIQAFLSVLGVIFLGLMVYGGYKWMVAQGREEEVKKAKEIIQAAVTGLAIVLAAYAITYFIVYRFLQAAQAT